MCEVRRDGHFDEITTQLKKLSYGLNVKHCDQVLHTLKSFARDYEIVNPSKLDALAVGIAAYMITNHPDYASLAARNIVANHHKNTNDSFSETIKNMYNHVNEGSGLRDPLVADDVYEIIMKNAELLDSEIIYDRDFEYDYVGFRTLKESCLLKVQGKVVERPQHMLMRVAVGIYKDDIGSALRTYHLMSQHWFTHASPTLSSVGTPRPHLSSCDLVCMKEDSIKGTHAGKCASAIYLEPWHSDIFEFLDLRKNDGKEEDHARGRLFALLVPDLFMRRIEENGKWSLFCPYEVLGLADCWGQKFEDLYIKYETQGKATKVVSALSLWLEILKAQLQTGSPSMLFKDTCNRKSNQQNIGTIKFPNLCIEASKYTNPGETAVCSLASIALPRYVREKGVPFESQPSNKLVGSRGSKNRYFDFDKLAEVTSFVTKDINKVLDVIYNHDDTAKKSYLQHRPVGIGVQGLADTFILLGMPFDSPEARQLNKDIFETIYYHSLKASSELAALEGPYETYQGSPVSKGILQPDMWGVTPSDRWNWAGLREMISKNGISNSLLVAPIPTASTSQILGNNECVEPYASNIYNRRFLSGEVVVVNKHLLHDLTEMGLWSPALKDKIIYEDGSVNISGIPDELKAIYKTVWEMKQRALVDMAVDRGCYIDQIQSLNIHMVQPNFKKLTALHFYAWSKGLKSGMYYLKARGAVDAQIYC